MNKIYRNGDEIQSIGNTIENNELRVEEMFVNSICELIIETFDVNYNEQRIVRPLLKRLVSQKLNNVYPKDELGLLQQYEQYILDKASKRLIVELDLGLVKVNHDSQTHAKFASIIDRIKDLYAKKK